MKKMEMMFYQLVRRVHSEYCLIETFDNGIEIKFQGSRCFVDTINKEISFIALWDKSLVVSLCCDEGDDEMFDKSVMNLKGAFRVKFKDDADMILRLMAGVC